jgi:hypothetical protein
MELENGANRRGLNELAEAFDQRDDHDGNMLGEEQGEEIPMLPLISNLGSTAQGTSRETMSV